MNYLLDTNICIHFFRGMFRLDDKVEEIGIGNCAISEITLAELVFGAENSSNPIKNLDIIDRFADEVIILPILDVIYKYGAEKARLRKAGQIISDFDLLIGSTAVVYDLLMITENVKEFKRIKGIEIENWIKR